MQLVPVGVHRCIPEMVASEQRNSRDDQTNFDSSRLVLRRRYCSVGLAGIANYVTSTAEFLRPDPGWPKEQE